MSDCVKERVKFFISREIQFVRKIVERNVACKCIINTVVLLRSFFHVFLNSLNCVYLVYNVLRFVANETCYSFK